MTSCFCMIKEYRAGVAKGDRETSQDENSSAQTHRNAFRYPEKGSSPFRLIVEEFDLVEFLGEGSDGDLGFKSGEMRAQAEMRAPSEGEMGGWGGCLRPALDVEDLWIFVVVGIPVGCCCHDADAGVLGYQETIEFHVFMHDSDGFCDGSAVPKAFFDGAFDQLGVTP